MFLTPALALPLGVEVNRRKVSFHELFNNICEEGIFHHKDLHWYQSFSTDIFFLKILGQFWESCLDKVETLYFYENAF